MRKLILFSAKNDGIFEYNNVRNFNISLTNDIVSFELMGRV